jgi:CBS domain-containing protein
METVSVKDVMIPVSEYATVSEEATLHEAVLALEKAQQEFDRTRYRHRAILVYDKSGKVAGKLSQIDILRALEPKYEQIGIPRSTHYPFSPKFMKSLFKQFDLWNKPLDGICRKAGQKRVKEIMCSPGEGEVVAQEASLNEAIHMFVVGNHQSLLVAREDEIIGILRLTDVFHEVFNMIKACELQPRP